MNYEIQQVRANTLADYMNCIEAFDPGKNTSIYFRGEPDDYKENAFQASIYREDYLVNEHRIYREMQRFNDFEFTDDRTTFDRLSRMQHFLTPTRLIDLSEDAFTALYFAVSERKFQQHAIVYVVAINENLIKYCDSDTINVISNLAKLPLENPENQDKSKTKVCEIAREAIQKKWKKDKFNEKDPIQYLLHDIRDDVGHFYDIIQPQHIFSIQCVRPKLANTRIYGQKGAFFLFGLNPSDVNKCIPIIDYETDTPCLYQNSLSQSPIERILKIEIGCDINEKTIKKIGLTAPYVYPGLEKVSEYFRRIFKNK